MKIQDFANTKYNSPNHSFGSSSKHLKTSQLAETVTATLLFLTPIIIMFFLAAN